MEHEFPFGTSRPEKRTSFSGCSVPLGNFPLEWHPIYHFLKKERGWVGRGETFKILFQEGGGDWYLMFLWASCLPNNNSNRKFDISLVGALVSHQEWLLVSHNESECLCFNSCCAWRSTFYESAEEKRGDSSYELFSCWSWLNQKWKVATQMIQIFNPVNHRTIQKTMRNRSVLKWPALLNVAFR